MTSLLKHQKRLEFRGREREIVKNCKDAKIRGSLQECLLYGSPYSFWDKAVTLGLVTYAEMQEAREAYGDWNFYYIGD